MAFELFQNKNKKYYFRLKAKNSQIILQSEGYEDKKGAKAGIKSVIANASKEGNFEIKKAKDGRSYFVLKAKNGETIGKSQMYKSTGGLKNGIKSVGTNAVNEITEV